MLWVPGVFLVHISQADADDEVASYMTLKSPGPFRPPPSRASRRSVSRQSVHSVPGDPLVELMSRMVENSQQETLRHEQENLRREQETLRREQEAKEENLRREQEARRREQEMEKREQEAREETKRREQAFELREKEIRRQSEQREYDFRHQVQIEMENRFLHEKLAAAEKEKEKELLALREKQEIEHEKQEMEKLLELEKQQAEKLVSEKLFELEKQKFELEKQKNVQMAGQLVPGNPRAVSEAVLGHVTSVILVTIFQL